MDEIQNQNVPFQQNNQQPSKNAPRTFLLSKKIQYCLLVVFVFFLGGISGYYFRLSKESKVAVKSPPTLKVSQKFISPSPTIMPTSSSSDGNVIVIKNSGSTNFPAATLIVQEDGSGTITYAGQAYQLQHVSSPTKNFAKGTFAFLVSVVGQIPNVSQIPIAMCAKSASFGSTTVVTYRGFTSGDLQCIDSNAPQSYKILGTEVEKALTLAESTGSQ